MPDLPKRKTESMALKSYKPTTPGQRGLVLIDRSDLFKGRPVKALTEGLIKTGGRNNTGRITMWHKGGGAKRLYRIVDFKRTKFDMPAVVERIEYDPNRTAFIALVTASKLTSSLRSVWRLVTRSSRAPRRT
jgi:large subunit ribosomal protein L2